MKENFLWRIKQLILRQIYLTISFYIPLLKRLNKVTRLTHPTTARYQFCKLQAISSRELFTSNFMITWTLNTSWPTSNLVSDQNTRCYCSSKFYRIDVTHGGVCTCIKKGLKYTVLEDLQDDKIEAIWLQLQPWRLPRGLSCIIIANVYHPQTDKGVSDSEILLYLYDSMSTIESRFSNCGVLIMGKQWAWVTCVLV